MIVLICFNSFALSVSKFLDVFFFCRNELMKRRIQETDSNRVTFQSFDTVLRSLPADMEELLQELLLFLLLFRSRSFHGMHRFCPSPKNICSVRQRPIPSAPSSTAFFSICWCICVCTNFHCSVFVSPCHDSSELTSDCSIYSWDDSIVDVTCSTIDGDAVSFMDILFQPV